MSKYQIRYSNNTAAMFPRFGSLLGDISVPEYEYFNATLTEQINCAGTLTFSILPTNPIINDLALRKTTVMLYRDGTEIWRGRIIRMETNMLDQRTITCEGVLAWLYDLLLKGFQYDPLGWSPVNALMIMLVNYQQSCTPSRWIELGTVQPTEQWYPQIDDDYHTYFELISQLLASSGGFFRIRYDDFAYLDYLNYSTVATGQSITFGDNLFDVVKSLDATNVATTLRAEDSAGHTLVLTNAAMEAAFGKSEVYQYFNDCEDATVLARLAQEWFNANCLANTTINISALDLNLTDEQINAFYIGQPVRIISPPHGIDTTMILTGLQTDISNPTASQITLGAIPSGITNFVSTQGNSAGGSGGGNEYVKTINPTITQTGGNSTLTVTAAKKCGKVVQIGFNISITGNVAEGDNIYTGTLGNFLPVAYISTAAYYGVATPSAGVFRITASGEINFRLVKGALSNGATMYCGLTYITKE